MFCCRRRAQTPIGLPEEAAVPVLGEPAQERLGAAAGLDALVVAAVPDALIVTSGGSAVVSGAKWIAAEGK